MNQGWLSIIGVILTFTWQQELVNDLIRMCSETKLLKSLPPFSGSIQSVENFTTVVEPQDDDSKN